MQLPETLAKQLLVLDEENMITCYKNHNQSRYKNIAQDIMTILSVPLFFFF